jgi:hypothetical protein
LNGLIYGLNAVYTKGSDIKDPDLGLNGVNVTFASHSLIEGKNMARYDTHIGFHSERTYFKKRIGWVLEFIYSKKGFRTEHKYNVGSIYGTTLKTTANVRLNYLDIPIMLRVNFPNSIYVFGGEQIAFFLPSFRVSTYYQFFDDSPADNVHGYFNANSSYYFGESPRIFLKGWVGGVGFILDDRVDFNIRIQKTNEILETTNYHNITAQLSLIYLFAKR